MKPDDYNHLELTSGRLTTAEITVLVMQFQAAHGLKVDGKAGPVTQAAIEKLLPPAAVTPANWNLGNPLPALPDGRRATITSEYRTASRPDHDGVDLFYRWKQGDQPARRGNGLAAGKNPDGTPKWVVPFGVCALAAAAGTVQIAGNTKTGYRLWIDHGNGYRTGYFHLLDVRVAVGQFVELGCELGQVGDNPNDKGDARHLHFELSPVDRYAPIDPAPYLRL